MKSVSILMSVLLVGATSQAMMSWECKAYCWDSAVGPVLMRDQAEHPLKALRTMKELCLRGQSEAAVEIAKLPPLTVEPFASSEEATVQNSCKIVDPTVY